MFDQYVGRILRRKWSALGNNYLQGSPDQQRLMQAIVGHGAAMDQLVEELATLIGRPVPALHRDTFEIKVSGPDAGLNAPVHEIPDTPPDSYSALTINNYDSSLDPESTEVTGGYAGVFNGVLWGRYMFGPSAVFNNVWVNNTLNINVNAGLYFNGQRYCFTPKNVVTSVSFDTGTCMLSVQTENLLTLVTCST